MVGDIIYKRSSRMNIAALGAVMNVKYDRIAKRVFQENKTRQIFRKTNISYPLIRTHTCAYQKGKNVLFSENLACFVTVIRYTTQSIQY